jgi:Flp pilus assembly protein TadB
MSAAAALTAATVGLLAWQVRPRRSRTLPAADADTAAHSGGRRAVTRALAHAADRAGGRWNEWRLRRAGVPPEAVALWCDELARWIRSGSTLRDSLATTVPSDITVRRATDVLRLRLERGGTVVEAVHDATAGTGKPHDGLGAHLDLAMAAIASSARVGGPGAVALEHTAAALRLRAADRQERLAHAAQARLSAHVLTVVPLAMLGLLCLTDADVRDVLRSTIGAASVGAGLVGNSVGWVWMRRIIGATP